LNKILFYSICKWKKTIFSAHGALLIIPKVVLERLVPLYDERMFLFNEEEHLGRLAASKNIKTCYAADIKIYHKEDGSMRVSNVNQSEQAARSYMVYYDRWIRGKGGCYKL
jgi:GT2 family glycosyltransferase